MRDTAAPQALLVAGEASGDLYGSVLVAELRRRFPSWRFSAFGGAKMAAAGAKLVCPLVDEAVIGISEALARLPRYWRIWCQLKHLLRTERPSPVIVIDYPGFNVRVARFARSLGLRTIYYIPPKVWVWKSWRAADLARLSDLIVTIFPFEPPLYERYDGNAVYVGHPLVDLVPPADSTPDPNLVALLPGSRSQEIARLLPRFLAAAEIIRRRRPATTFAIPRAHTVAPSMLTEHLARHPDLPVAVVDDDTAAVLHRSRAALAASGTVTLEAAIIGTPMVVAYAVNLLSALVFRWFVHPPHVGLPNIVAGRTVCPELLQDDATPERLAETLLPLVDDGPTRQAQLDGLSDVRRLLGEPGAIGRIVSAMAPYFQEGAPAACP